MLNEQSSGLGKMLQLYRRGLYGHYFDPQGPNMRHEIIGRAAAALLVSVSCICPGVRAENSETARATGHTVTLNFQAEDLPKRAIKRFGTLLLRHGDGISSLCCPRDSRYLVSTGYNGRMCIWDLATGAAKGDLKTDNRVDTVASCSADGKLIAVAGDAGTVSVWNAENRTCLGQLGHANRPLTSVSFSPKGSLIASGGCDGTIYLWSAEDLDLVASFKASRSYISRSAFSTDGKTLAVGDGEGWISLRSVATNDLIRRWQAHEGGVTCLLAHPDGIRFVSSGDDGMIRQWNASSGAQIQQFKGHSQIVRAMALSPDGRCLAAAGGWFAYSRDPAIQLWDTASGKLIASLKESISRTTSLVFFADGKGLASGHVDGTIRLWDASSLRQIVTSDGHTGPIEAIAVSKDLATVATASFDKTIRLWDLRTARVTKELRRHDGGILSMVFTPDNRRLVSGGTDDMTRVWDVVTGRQVLAIPAKESAVECVAVSPDGKMLASGTRGAVVYLCDLASGKLLRELQVNDGICVHAVAFSPDGRLLASADDRIRIWNVATGNLVQELDTRREDQGFVNCLIYSRSRKTLISVNGLGKIRVRNTQQPFRLVKQSETPKSEILALALSPDEAFLASATTDAVITIWEMDTLKQVDEFGGHKGAIHGLVFPSFDRLLSASQDTTALMWDVVPAEVQRGEFGRTLTAERFRRMWQDLASENARTGYSAMWSLVVAGDQSASFLGKELRPATSPTSEVLSTLVRELESDQFSIRTRASAELRKLGQLAEPALRGRLAEGPGPEGNRRILQLLDMLEDQTQNMQVLRGIQVLERIGTRKSVEIMALLASGSSNARTTIAAKTSMHRMAKKQH